MPVAAKGGGAWPVQGVRRKNFCYFEASETKKRTVKSIKMTFQCFNAVSKEKKVCMKVKNTKEDNCQQQLKEEVHGQCKA